MIFTQDVHHVIPGIGCQIRTEEAMLGSVGHHVVKLVAESVPV
jgi:hypothetical protein